MKIPAISDDERFEEDAETGPGSAGQSGDTQGLAGLSGYDSEEVKELLEEGQAFEASVLAGIENAPPADAGGVRTRQVPEDDVPTEYLQDKESER